MSDFSIGDDVLILAKVIADKDMDGDYRLEIDEYCSVFIKEKKLISYKADQRSRLMLAGQILAAMYSNPALISEQVTYKRPWGEVALDEADALLVEHERREAQDAS